MAADPVDLELIALTCRCGAAVASCSVGSLAVRLAALAALAAFRRHGSATSRG